LIILPNIKLQYSQIGYHSYEVSVPEYIGSTSFILWGSLTDTSQPPNLQTEKLSVRGQSRLPVIKLVEPICSEAATRWELQNMSGFLSGGIKKLYVRLSCDYWNSWMAEARVVRFVQLVIFHH
jgi:hypothetical protein